MHRDAPERFRFALRPIVPQGRPAPARRASRAQCLLLAVAERDRSVYPADSFTQVPVQTTADALDALVRRAPRVVAVDWDLEALDADLVCRAAVASRTAAVLAVTASPERAPDAIKAGCHAVLLKPFAPNLVAARLARLSRAAASWTRPRRADERSWPPLHRVRPRTRCPRCSAPGTIGFEFAARSRSWYACLSCDHVWQARG